MAYSASDVAQLEAAIGTGAMRVRYADGREVTYRTLAEMREILRTMKAEVAGAAAPSRSIMVGF